MLKSKPMSSRYALVRVQEIRARTKLLMPKGTEMNTITGGVLYCYSYFLFISFFIAKCKKDRLSTSQCTGKPENGVQKYMYIRTNLKQISHENAIYLMKLLR